jgi:hypothetical protein
VLAPDELLEDDELAAPDELLEVEVTCAAALVGEEPPPQAESRLAKAMVAASAHRAVNSDFRCSTAFAKLG